MSKVFLELSKIEKGRWLLWLHIGHQSFEINMGAGQEGRSRSSAKWFAQQLQGALKRAGVKLSKRVVTK